MLYPRFICHNKLINCFFEKGSAGKKRKKLEDLDPLSYYEAIRDMKKKKKEERLKAHA
jgi:hypothetical protein